MPADQTLPEGFAPLPGSHIKAWRAIECGIHKHRELQLLFATGARYHYQDVPLAHVDAFKADPHPGAYLARSIKPLYHAYRANPETGKPSNG